MRLVGGQVFDPQLVCVCARARARRAKGHWDRFLCTFLYSPQSLSRYQCLILNFILILHLSEGQAGQTGNVQTKFAV